MPADGIAPGGPGLEPRWATATKDAVGTAASSASHLWYTLAEGVVTEVYWPTIDRPQLRDLQFLISDGDTFFHEERTHLVSTVEPLGPGLGVRVISTDPEGRYRIEKEVLSDPDQSCLLIKTRFSAGEDWRWRLHLYLLCAPHLEIGGWGNDAEVTEVSGRRVFLAHKGQTWMALGASVPFLRASVGYVGVNDGWTDLAADFQMEWTFAKAENGNLALTAELDLEQTTESTVALAFSDCRHGAITALLQTLGRPFGEHRARFRHLWEEAVSSSLPLGGAAGDGGRLYHVSQCVLLAHEDKLYQGAMIASLSIPWGESKGDEELGGYHLVWTRDLVNCASGLMAAGYTGLPQRALIYLAASQRPDGGFYQNFWISGAPYWHGVQLDEVAFPIILAWRLHRAGGMGVFDPYQMVLRAAGYLVRNGPATPQERWEEAGGYSPSTLASTISALVCAAAFAAERGDRTTAEYLRQHADFLECHVEAWTVTTHGELVPGVPRHYIRIHPVDVGDPYPAEDPNRGLLRIANQAPGRQAEFPAKDVVDAGFLELVRYGIREPRDSLIEDSLAAVDAVLRTETPVGPVWRRYNHDGYGQRDDGGPFQGWGRGRGWPLLTGERGSYEVAAGRSAARYVRAMESFAGGVGLLPEQVWDDPSRPELLGRPTGAAMPLMWAHSEYIKLLRSITDGQTWGHIPEVAERYRRRTECLRLEVWKPNRRPRQMAPGTATLRVQAPRPFLLRWTAGEWSEHRDTASTPTAIGVEYVDISIPPGQRNPIRFVFGGGGRWEEEEHRVEIG